LRLCSPILHADDWTPELCPKLCPGPSSQYPKPPNASQAAKEKLLGKSATYRGASICLPARQASVVTRLHHDPALGDWLLRRRKAKAPFAFPRSYKSVLHHAANTSPVWWLETVGIYTSLLNRCEYSTAHHFAGLSRLLADGPRAEAIYRALAADDPGRVFAGKELALLRYARKLTLAPGEMAESDVVTLRDAGATDEEILETNQVVA
jgi:alkylhydroperoxidase family enzyme